MALSIGIDFGGTSVKMGVCKGAEIVERLEPLPTEGFDGSEALIGALVERVLALRERFAGVEAVGVGVPGFVAPERGLIHQLTNVKGWVKVPLRGRLEELTGLPSAVLNDANAMTMAEWKYGAGIGCDDLVCLTLGTGVGGGLIINGRLLTGSVGGAGEIGQMSIDFEGKTGVYGNRGCVEKYVGNRQLAERARDLYEEAGQARELGALEPVHLARLAQEGDNIARRVWREAGEQLACVIANVSWLLNPSRVVIGGGVAQAGSLLFEPLHEALEEQLSELHWGSMGIVPACFGNDAGLIGAAAAGLDRIQGDLTP